MVESNIHNIESFRNGIWQWRPYNDCFFDHENRDLGIRISDIDGHVERNGHFLWVEATSKDIVSIGQMRSIKHRVMRGDTVVILFGQTNSPARMTIYRPHSEGRTISCNQQIVWKFFRGWMLWAEMNGYIPAKNWKS